MTTIFDGKEFARRKEKLLRGKVNKLLKLGIKPKLVSILVGDDPASLLYLNLKKKRAEAVGAEVEVLKLPRDVAMNRFIATIKKANNDQNVHGIMVQLPLPRNLRHETKDLINAIVPEKDVDGLRDDSPFVPAAVRAILSIIDEAQKILNLDLNLNYCVVGSKGMVGRRLYKELRRMKHVVVGVDLNTKYIIRDTKYADVLVSATGVPGLIKADMVKNGAIVIDVGSPKGDVQFNQVAKKASFITPVPGGIGPVTIACLLENLVETVSKRR